MMTIKMEFNYSETWHDHLILNMQKGTNKPIFF